MASSFTQCIMNDLSEGVKRQVVVLKDEAKVRMNWKGRSQVSPPLPYFYPLQPSKGHVPGLKTTWKGTWRKGLVQRHPLPLFY